MKRARAELTPRERDVLQLLWEGHQMKEIAAQLGLAPSTVRNRANTLFLRLQVHSQTQAIRRALELGLLRVQATEQGEK